MLIGPRVAMRQYLRLAALEQARAVGARQDADVAGDLPQLVDGAAVGALALLEDAVAHRLLDHGFERLAELLVRVRRRRSAVVSSAMRSPSGPRRALAGNGGEDLFVDSAFEELGDHVDQAAASSVLGRVGFDLRLGQLLDHLVLDLDDLLVGLVRDLDGLDDDVLRDAVGAGLDHDHLLAGRGDDQVQVALFELGVKVG